MTPDVPIATIDGPSSSGKGTISRIVAARVGWHLLDSGALYRLVALGGILRKADPDDVEQHIAVARSMNVEFGSTADGQERVTLDGEDVTRRIRTEEAGAGASPDLGAARGWRPHGAEERAVLQRAGGPAGTGRALEGALLARNDRDRRPS